MLLRTELLPRGPRPRPPRTLAALLALTLIVTLIHLTLADRTLPSRLGDGAADRRPQRIQVAFVRELQRAAPPGAPPAASPTAAPAAPLPRVNRLRPLPPQAAASAAESTQPLPAAEPPPPRTAQLDALLPLPDLAAAPAMAPGVPPLVSASVSASTSASAAASASTAEAAAAAFEWPPSTRLSYTLSGNFQGPVQGQAQVEWLRAGTRYQIHLDISVGPSFAPLMSRRISSEGEITAEGLQPRRYDEETRIVLREPRRLSIVLDNDAVHLPDGRVLPRPAGVQDSASQFVQMTWLFTMQPARLQPGRTVELPLALPRRVEPWTYDVLASETLDTPAGPVPAVHVKPRREGRAGQELTAELWVAPSLQYLPVRILIRQDAQSYVDLLIERLPQQAERGR
ncbi:MAG: DUF3108 domain-containing protein [Rubrivivax sp.]|nr:DUF3108 domain-containing protein [Rubrivivax sp.]